MRSSCFGEYGAIVTYQEEEEAMIARFDHRPRLTALLALTTAVLVVVVITLSTLLITSVPATSHSRVGAVGYDADSHGKAVADYHNSR
jgi:hypothetical protein